MERFSKFTSNISFLWKWFKDMIQQNTKVNQKKKKNVEFQKILNRSREKHKAGPG